MSTDPYAAFTQWHKSTYSNGGDNCVLLSFAADGRVAVRNSNDPRLTTIVFTAAEWDAFEDGFAAGELRRPH